MFWITNKVRPTSSKHFQQPLRSVKCGKVQTKWNVLYMHGVNCDPLKSPKSISAPGALLQWAGVKAWGDSDKLPTVFLPFVQNQTSEQCSVQREEPQVKWNHFHWNVRIPENKPYQSLFPWLTTPEIHNEIKNPQWDSGFPPNTRWQSTIK